jgi:Ca-activated chloride channel family protein
MSESQGQITTPQPLTLSARWERPVLPVDGGSLSLLVRIAASDRPQPGQRRAPLDVAFVIDRSGSMQGDKLALVKEAVTTASTLLNDDDRAAVVVYDDRVELLRSLEPATSRAKAAMRLALHGVDARGSTDLCSGWLTGCEQLAGALDREGPRSRIRRALLLTDGLANMGVTDPSRLMRHATELRQRGISTTSLGVGEDFDESLLSGMSEAGGGNFQYIATPNQLSAFFQAELGELLTMVAGGLNLSLTLPPGVRAHPINAFPAERQGKTITVAIGDLPAGRQIDLIFDVTVERGQTGTLHVPTLTANWTDVASDRRRDLSLTLPALRIGSDEEAGAVTVDEEVVKATALERSDAAQREAMRLDRQGRYAESRARLRQGLQFIAAAPMSPELRVRAQQLTTLAEHDEDRAYSSDTHKQVTFDAMRRSRGYRDFGK